MVRGPLLPAKYMLQICMDDSISFRHKDQFRDAARRLIWWMRPSQALRQPLRLIVQIMDIGSLTDLRLLQQEFTDTELIHFLQHAPPGHFICPISAFLAGCSENRR